VLQAEVEVAQVRTHCGLAVCLGPSYVSEIVLNIWSKMLGNYHLFDGLFHADAIFFLWYEVQVSLYHQPN